MVRTLSREFIRVPLSFVEYRREPKGQFRKEKQKAPDKNEGDQKWRGTLVDNAYRNLRYIFYHEYTDGYRRDDNADHFDNGDHNPEPQGREAEFEGYGIKIGVARIIKVRSSMKEPPIS